MDFSNIKELKNRVMPALRIRSSELKKSGYNYTEDDIWNYFIIVWKNSHNLTLSDIVNDILNSEIDKK